MTLRSQNRARKSPANGSGPNRETANGSGFGCKPVSGAFRKTGGKLPIRPDGGVVTQRTANPLPHPNSRESLLSSRSVPRTVCRGADVLIANCRMEVAYG
jgi:hypothetical protein